jgi:hypothetical protein
MIDVQPEATASSTSPRNRWAVALVVVGIVLFVVRGIDRLLHPVLWAEDGAVFFSEQVTRGGAGAVLEPYAGYLHTLPRAIAALVSPAPFTAAPTLYAVAAVVVTLAVFAVVLSPRLGWLVPSATARSVVFLLLCVSPVLTEIYGNIANLIFVGGIGLVLIALCDAPMTSWGRAAELIAVAVLATSGPLVVFVLPLFLARWWRGRRSMQSTSVLVVAVAGAAIQIATYVFSERTTQGGGSALLIVRALIERDAGGVLYGYNDLFDGSGGPPLAAAVAAIWLVVVAIVTIAVLRRDAVIAWITVVAMTAAPTLAYGDLFLASPLNGQRHVITPAMIMVVLLVASAVRADSRRMRITAIVALAVGAYAVLTSLVFFAHSANTDMAGLQRCWDSGAEFCSTPIAPSGWTVVLIR